MKRAIAATAATAAGIVLLLSGKPHHAASAAPLAQGGGSGSSGATSTPGGTSGGSSAGTTGSTGTTGSSGSTSGSSGGTGSTGTTKSGTFTGTSVDTQYGPVQVQVTMAGGRLTQVNVLQYPNDRSRSQEINSRALPVLTKETLAAQGANIDAVSGATYTSGGYVQSLQSALDQARA